MSLPAQVGYKFVVTANSVIRAGDVSAVAAELATIKAEHGELTPRLVWEASKKPDSVLRRYFTKDVRAAAIQWWLSQARDIVQSVYVIIENDDDAVPVRWVHSLKSTPVEEGAQVTHSYYTLEEIRNSETMRAQLLNQSMADIEVWQRKYSHLHRFFAIVGELNGSMTKALKKHRKKTGQGRRRTTQ